MESKQGKRQAVPADKQINAVEELEKKTFISTVNDYFGPDRFMDAVTYEKSNLAENGEIIDPFKDNDFFLCARYVQEVELNRTGRTQDIAEAMGISYNLLKGKIGNWRKTGLLQKVRQEIFRVIYSEVIDSAQQQAVSRWGEIVSNQIDTALSTKSRRNALDAAKWLNETFIQPAKEHGAVDTLEGNYLKSLGDSYDFNPLSIVDAEFEEIELTGDDD